MKSITVVPEDRAQKMVRGEKIREDMVRGGELDEYEEKSYRNDS